MSKPRKPTSVEIIPPGREPTRRPTPRTMPDLSVVTPQVLVNWWTGKPDIQAFTRDLHRAQAAAAAAEGLVKQIGSLEETKQQTELTFAGRALMQERLEERRQELQHDISTRQADRRFSRGVKEAEMENAVVRHQHHRRITTVDNEIELTTRQAELLRAAQALAAEQAKLEDDEIAVEIRSTRRTQAKAQEIQAQAELAEAEARLARAKRDRHDIENPPPPPVESEAEPEPSHTPELDDQLSLQERLRRNQQKAEELRRVACSPEELDEIENAEERAKKDIINGASGIAFPAR